MTKAARSITTRSVEVEVPLFEQSDDWVLQFDLAYNEDGQGKNGPFSAHIATKGQRPDGVKFSEKLKALMWLKLTSLWGGNLTESYISTTS